MTSGDVLQSPSSFLLAILSILSYSFRHILVLLQHRRIGTTSGAALVKKETQLGPRVVVAQGSADMEGQKGVQSTPVISSIEGLIASVAMKVRQSDGILRLRLSVAVLLSHISCGVETC